MIIVNRKDDSIVQQISSSISTITMNGRYMLDEPDFVKVNIAPSSTVTSLRTDISTALLGTYNNYRGIIYNPLLTPTDISKVDTTTSRYQIGTTPNTVAIYPNATGIYTVNMTIPSGSDKFLVYWRSAKITYSEDTSPLIGQANNPTLLQYDLSGTDDFDVYIVGTPDAISRPVNLLESISYTSNQTDAKLVFVNNSSNKLHLLAFAIIYV
jgi:hypothetical protein